MTEVEEREKDQEAFNTEQERKFADLEALVRELRA
jgi:hypothetical protein